MKETNKIKNLVNWNILVAKEKKINKDFVSSGERTWSRRKKKSFEYSGILLAK